MAERRPGLSDPEYAAFAWARYRRLMRWMALAAFTTAAVALGALWWAKGPLPIHLVIASALGIFCSVLLAAALMGLVFLSSGTGHDESIMDFSEEQHD